MILMGLMLIALSHTADTVKIAGQKDVVLCNVQSRGIVIGRMNFLPDGDSYRFERSPDRIVVKKYFIGMRSFLCLDEETRSLCYFPYDQPWRITPRDRADLEYRLMLIRKPRYKVSLGSWNGIYYPFEWNERSIEDVIRAVDITSIVVPEGKTNWPIRHDDQLAVDPANQWLPYLTFE